MQADTETFTTSDGIPILVRCWTAKARPRGVVQVVHGLAEHCARYAEMAEAFTAAGWHVVAHDHRGHGASVRDEGDRGHFADEDGWTLAVDDILTVGDRARELADGQPVVLLGHSMGSTLAVHTLVREPERYDGVVLTGPVGKTGLLRAAGLQICRFERWRLGLRGRSRLLHSLSFGDFNKPFQPARTDYDWLSRDPYEVDAYANDPLCGFIVTTQHWFDHLVALGQLADPAWLAGLPRDVPMLVASGELDPVNAQTRQLGPWIDHLADLGLDDVTVEIYPEARHELFHETNRAEVFDDVLAWIDRKLGARTIVEHDTEDG